MGHGHLGRFEHRARHRVVAQPPVHRRGYPADSARRFQPRRRYRRDRRRLRATQRLDNGSREAGVSNPQPASSGTWWAFALRGLFAVFFGLLVIIWPNLALFTLPLLLALLGLYILIDGIIAIVGAMRSSERRRWLLLVEGILGILAGLIALFRPGIAALAVLYLV